MKIVSYIEDGKDIFDLLMAEIKKQRIFFLKEDALIKKIRLGLECFLLKQHPDGSTVKCVGGSIHELRFVIGGTSCVGRIFFHRGKDKIILLTGSLVKPRDYEDKQTASHIQNQYADCIKKSYEIVQDYMTTQKYEYGFISLSSI